MKSRITEDCGRLMGQKDIHLEDLRLDTGYYTILQLIRLYMQSVSHPQSMAWIAALTNADEAFGRIYGPQIASRTLEVLQHMRLSRRSMFSFNSPTCPSCCQIVTEHERRFMVALECAKAGLTGRANMELIMLCEGNDVWPVRQAMDCLNALIADALLHNALSQNPDKCSMG